MPVRSDQHAIHQAADECIARVELLLRDPLVRLVRLRDVARAADDGRNAGGLVESALGAVAHLAGAVRPGELLDDRCERMVGVQRQSRHGRHHLEVEAGAGVHRTHRRFDVGGHKRPHAFDVARRIVLRDGAPLHGEFAPFGDDVEDRAALNGADMDRGVRRIEAVLERAFSCQPARFRRDMGDRLAGGLDRVDPLARFAGMAGQAAHAHAQVQLALVRQDRLHAGRFADDTQRRLQTRFVEVAQQPSCAVATHLLVVADEQVQRAREVARLDVGHRGKAGGNKALHVGRAARIKPAVRSAQGERIGAPGLAVDRNGIDMTGQRDAAGALRTDNGVDVGFLAGRIGTDAVRNSVCVQVVAHIADQREVGIAAGGVERHQPGEQFRCAETRRGGCGCIHRAAVYTDCKGRPTDGPSPRRHDIGDVRGAGDLMTTWLIRRLIQALFVVLAMSVIVFICVHVIGNPVDILISPEADQAERARIIAALGLDQPLWKQYLLFVNDALHGNLGRSFVFNEPALRLIAQRMPATMELAVTAVLMSILFGIPLGLYAGLYPEGAVARTIMAGSILGFSLPTFWVGLMLIMVFAVQLGWLPSTGRGTTAELLGIQWSFLTLDGLRHLLLPAVNLSLFNISLVLRLTRAGVRETLPMDFVKFARAKGLTPARVIFVHVLKNIMIPVVTVVGLELGSTIAFAVVTESVFAWPGMGKLIIDSINVLDRPVIVAYLMMIVLLFVTINLVVDVLYTVLDPRVRLETKG